MDSATIQAIYNNCNFIALEELIGFVLDPNSGITLDGLQAAGYKKYDQLRSRVGSRIEEQVWREAQLSENKVQAYIKDCDAGMYPGKYKDDAIALLKRMQAGKEEEEWERAKRSESVDDIQLFLDKCASGVFSSKHTAEARQLMSEWAYSCAAQKLNEIKSLEDLTQKETELNLFIEKNRANGSEPGFSDLLHTANQLLDGIKDEAIARVDWLDTCRKDDIMSYVHFVENHPYCTYREKADEIIKQRKGDLLNDMRLHPSAYDRTTMHELLSKKILTQKDLVEDSYILTDRAYNQILEFPTLGSEQRVLPVSTIENPESQEGNTDVIFFGVSGSGKTCVLAGLLSLAGRNGFSFDPRGNGGGGDYAMDLQQYARCSKLPPATDQNYIQIIDSEITDDDGKVHNISLIEMSGEKTAAFASLKDSNNLEDLGPGAANLLNNNNMKMLFFVIDPTNEKHIMMGQRSSVVVHQSNVLDCVASLLSKNVDLLRKVISIHIILTKSDAIGDHLTPEQIADVLEKQNYSATLDRLKKICQKANINAHKNNEIGLTPFSLGVFRPGQVYTFDDTSATKILQIIRENTPLVRPSTFRDRFMEWFNRE